MLDAFDKGVGRISQVDLLTLQEAGGLAGILPGVGRRVTSARLKRTDEDRASKGRTLCPSAEFLPPFGENELSRNSGIWEGRTVQAAALIRNAMLPRDQPWSPGERV